MPEKKIVEKNARKEFTKIAILVAKQGASGQDSEKINPKVVHRFQIQLKCK